MRASYPCVLLAQRFTCSAALLVALTVLLAAAPAQAKTCTWVGLDGGGDGFSWNDPNNWEDTNLDPCEPGIGDTAIINGVVELDGIRTVDELQLSGTLTVNEGAVLNVVLLSLDDGSIQGAGEVDVEQEADLSSGGTISLSFTLPADSDTPCGSRLRIGNGSTFTNNGTLSGSCIIDMEAGSTLDNYGLIEAGISISVVGAKDNGVEEVTPYPIVNNKPDATMRTGTNAIFNNEGTVEVNPNGFVDFSGGGTSNGTFIVPAETSPNDGLDNAVLRFEERFGITPHDLTGATVQGGGTVQFWEFRSPLTLNNVDYDLSGAPEAQTHISGADVTFPASMTLGGLGQRLNLSDEDGQPGVLTVEHDVAFTEFDMRNGTFGGSGAVTVSDAFQVYSGTIDNRTVTIDGVGNIGSSSDIRLTGGTSVTQNADLDVDTITMADGTAWTNNATLTVDPGGLFTTGTISAPPTVTNNGLLQTDFGNMPVEVDLVNNGEFRIRATVTVTSAFTNAASGTVSGTGQLDWSGASAVTNNGTFAPGRPDVPYALLGVVGDVVMNTNTTLAIEGAPGFGDVDELEVDGAVALDGTLDLSLDDVPIGSYEIITLDYSSTETITGTFGQVSAPSGYTTSLTYNTDNVTLDVTGTPYPLLSTSPADIDFNDAEVGDTETVEIENVGSGTLTLSGATLSGADAARFEVVQPSFPVDLNTGETVDVAVQVVGPETSGSVSAQLDIAHNGDVDGTATTAVPLAADQLVNPNFGDAAGYFFANSTFFSDDAASQPTFDWIDISSTGTDRIGDLSDDSVVGPFDLGFTFRFFGQDVTQYWISSNGWISFTDPMGEDASSNEEIPYADAPNALVAWFWDDLDPSETNVTDRHLYTQATTVNGTDAHVITFARYPEYGADADGWITGQVVLLAGADATTNGSIKLQYKEHGASIDLEGATVGIENASGSSGLQYRYDDTGGPLFSSPLAVQIGPDAAALPVELATFDAAQSEDGVQLRWQTASETNNAGFAVERQVDGGAFTEVGFVEGAGTTNQPRRYRFTDDAVPYGVEALTYRLKQVDTDGTSTYSPDVEVGLDAPERLVLHGNYPNPFRMQTTLRYELPQAGQVRIAVYDMVGRRVAMLVNEEQPAGRKEVVFDAQRLASGVYFVRFRAGGRTLTQKLTVVR